MSTILGFFVLVIAVHVLRILIVNWKTSPKNHEVFDGELLQVEECVVALKRPQGKKPVRTIVGMHGFLEDHRYFTDHYGKVTDAELILINSCGYHPPNTVIVPQEAPWSKTVPFTPGSIEYDAAVLIQAVENLASTSRLRVHGHSRGGAVVLEAARQRPDLFKKAEAILEAPILPEAPVFADSGLRAVFDRAYLYFFPFAAALFNITGLPRFVMKNLGPLGDRKATMLRSLFNNPKSPGILVQNLLHIARWPQDRTVDLFDGFASGTILIGEQDHILSRRRMLASAQRNKGNLQVVETTGTDHFILLERPELIPALPVVAGRSGATAKPKSPRRAAKTRKPAEKATQAKTQPAVSKT